MTIRNTRDFSVGMVMFLVAVYFYYETYNIYFMVSYALGPLLVPRFILGSTMILCLLLAWENIDFADHKSQDFKKMPFVFQPHMIFQMGTVVSLFIYIIVLPHLSYVPATLLFLMGLMVFLGPKNLKSICISAVLAVVTTFFLEYIFGTLLNLFLP